MSQQGRRQKARTSEPELRAISELRAHQPRLTHGGPPPLAGIAGALREDQHAVPQGVITTNNSGVNKGRSADVELQKRLMAGRAGVPLPRHRVALTAYLRRGYAGRTTTAPR
ncbi:hypothetical protein [Streptomyces sp. NBC_01429]|uniref:hypothetical protein n=1 Tax=Streptomyces sp. NBC_01429 TaxID=2903862 RepID=UPI002E2E4FA1|nr:hypothetical protein [Streptomyces sp. NBC_01429]